MPWQHTKRFSTSTLDVTDWHDFISIRNAQLGFHGDAEKVRLKQRTAARSLSRERYGVAKITNHRFGGGPLSVTVLRGRFELA